MNKLKISIALATYNGDQYLQAQLDSFVGQTRLPDELVITDDASTDETLDIVRRFAENAPFTVIWSQNEKTLGYGGNFSTCLTKTTGDLVFLSDQDDVWFPEKIARIAGLAEAEPRALVLMNDAALTDATLRETGLTKLGQIRSAGYGDQAFQMGCCAAVRRELLDLCLPIPAGRRSHDGWIVGIADGLQRKRIVPEILQYYRRHGENESQWIVNRTTPVTRWHVRGDNWRKRLRRWTKRSVAKRSTANSPKPLREAMLDWARASAPHAPDWLRADLARFQDDLEWQCQAVRKRQEIRALPLAKRPVRILALWRSGGYAYFSGVKSALLDVVAPTDC